MSRIADLTLVEIVFPSSLCAPYKGLPSINNIFTRASFFLPLSLFHFHCTLFRGLAGAYVNLESFSLLYIHLFIKSLTHFLTDFSQTCVSTSPMHALPVIILFSA